MTLRTLPRRKRILELLSQAQLAASQGAERARPSPLVEALARECAVPAIDVRTLAIADDVWKIVPVEVAEKHVVVPLARKGNVLTLAMADPTSLFARDDVKFLTGYELDVVVADDGDLRSLIAARKDRHVPHCVPPDAPEEPCVELIPPANDSEHVVDRLAALVLRDAINKNAREVIVEPRAKYLVVSYVDALDGSVFEAALAPPLKIAKALCDVLRATRGVKIGAREIDLDSAVFETRFGPQVSVRIYPRQQSVVRTLPHDWCSDADPAPLPWFADAARIEPSSRETGVVWLSAGPAGAPGAAGWRPTWTYPMSQHAALLARVKRRAARKAGDDDEFIVAEDECANGVRLFLRKRS